MRESIKVIKKMPDIFPNVYVKENSTVQKIFQEDFATLFITLNEYGFESPIVVLENFTQIHQHSFLGKNLGLKKAIEIFFANKGKKLYILNYPLEKNSTFNIVDFEEFLVRTCDTLNDLEVLCCIDIYNTKRDLNQHIIPIFHTINNYCQKNHKISITDITKEIEEKHLDRLGETTIYYPWIIEKSMESVPPSIFVSSLLSKFAFLGKAFTSPANKEILNAVDVEKTLKKSELEKLTETRINPIIYVPHNGVRVWGTKTFNSNIDTTVEMRILKYIKRKLYRIAKVYIFELNDSSLEDKILSQVEEFLYKLWEKGTLVGASKNEAYKVVVESNSNENLENALIVHIGVALVKPLEFIYIELNKVEQDGTQTSLSVN